MKVYVMCQVEAISKFWLRRVIECLRFFLRARFVGKKNVNALEYIYEKFSFYIGGDFCFDFRWVQHAEN